MDIRYELIIDGLEFDVCEYAIAYIDDNYGSSIDDWEKVKESNDWLRLRDALEEEGFICQLLIVPDKDYSVLDALERIEALQENILLNIKTFEEVSKEVHELLQVIDNNTK